MYGVHRCDRLRPDSGDRPQCGFMLRGPGTWFVQIDVNGTGQVSGAMRVEEIGSSEGVGFIRVTSTDFTPVPGPSCGPTLFRCSAKTELNADSTAAAPILLVPDFVLTRVTCTGGGLAVSETVSCSVSEF